MSKKEWIVRLDHILDEIAHIQVFIEAYTSETFREDIKTVRAAERSLEIIGEATKHIPEHVKIAFQTVPWRDIVGTRNIISHLYDGVDEDILWDICKNRLPELAKIVTTIKTTYEKP